MTHRNFARSGSALDLSVASFAALSVAFVAVAMPADLFSGLVAVSGLPDLVAAAQPPLGRTARIAAAAGGAAAMFGLVFALLRALDRVPPRARTAEVAPEAPRLRRADLHPDAPARRPLLAGHELGEPESELPREPPPPPAEAQEEIEAAPAVLPAFLAVEQPPEAEQVEAEAEVLELRDEQPTIDILAERLPKRAGDGEEESLAKLMRRLDRGLTRRRPEPAEEPPPSAAAVSEDHVGHRLRSAIADLQQIGTRRA